MKLLVSLPVIDHRKIDVFIMFTGDETIVPATFMAEGLTKVIKDLIFLHIKSKKNSLIRNAFLNLVDYL